MSLQLLKDNPHLNDLDREVLSVIGDGTDLFDPYNYPTNSAVERISSLLDKHPWDVYYSLKALRMFSLTMPLTPQPA
jgi:hypothetical protein